MKRLDILPEDTGVGDRLNMVFMGTIVTGGRAVALVTETGMKTEFGKIAGMVQAIEVEDPPLRQKMEKMGRQLGAISVILTIWVFLIGFFIHEFELETMFMTAISLAVSAIPEGLPAVLTITLALGVSRMAKQKSIEAVNKRDTESTRESQRILESYLIDLKCIYDSGSGVEETSYYPAIANLFNAVGKALKPSLNLNQQAFQWNTF